MRDKEQTPKMGSSRREFLKSSAFLGGTAVLASQVPWVWGMIARAQAGELAPGEEYELNKAENIIYSVCLQCHTACPIKAKLQDGVLVKIDGNPYSPQNMLPHLLYETAPEAAAQVDGKLCPKGQAGIQSLYDPWRIRKVLKRTGPRGSNQWETIPFDQAIDEIVNGGTLFSNVKGEENRVVPGLKELYALRDPDVGKAMAADAKKVARGEMSLGDFQQKHRSHLDTLIDPDHPDLGPKNNQFVFMAGRIEHGRKELAKRWLKGGFGSVNWYEHTTICEQSHHIAYEQMSNQYGGNGSWSGGKTHFKPDALNSEFILFFGTGAFEANFGPTNMAEKVTQGLETGRLKIAVVDPRLSKTAAKAWKWLPVTPGADGALALAITRWMIENNRYDAKFLQNANKAAAEAAGETCWSNASWLVKLAADGRPERLLRPEDIGLEAADAFVAMVDGEPTVFTPNDETTPVMGELLVDTTLEGVRVKSALQLLWEEASSRSLAEWSQITGIPEKDIAAVAKELTSYGKKAAVELYRGPVQHTNGYYNGLAIEALNVLIGNPDWQGGITAGGSHWHENGSKSGQPYPEGQMHPGKLSAFGVPLTREKSRYEESTLFKGYPAERPWYPFTSNVYQEILPSAEAGYPYPIQALFLHMGTPVYASPGQDGMIAYLQDVERLPLFIACDIVIAETSMYADYIFPDLSIWERWGTPHTSPDVLTKTSKIRQPIVAPMTETVKVYGEEQPISMEAVMLGIAERLNLPGFGPDGFGKGIPFTRMEDFFLKYTANVAMEGEPVKPASKEEMDLFLKARRHLPATVFDPARWEKAAGSQYWPHVVTVLNRGGRFEDFDKAYKGNLVGHTFKGQFNLFVENVARARHAVTGEWFSGVARYEPVRDAAGKEVRDDDYEFQLVTYKEIWVGQSRTPGNYWTQTAMMPENPLLMNRKDAARLGIKEGDRVRLVSATNPDGTWKLGNGKTRAVSGPVKIVEGVRPGVVAFTWGYGHWAYGAEDVVVDGVTVNGDGRRATGFCGNAVMRVDDHLKNVCLTDPIGGSASFYDTRVKLVKISG